MPWLFLLIGIAIGAGLVTLWYAGVEDRLQAEIDRLRDRGPNVIDLTGMREKRAAGDRRPW